MTKIAKIAIVGRPNVGKSSLFNRICKKRSSIVDEAEGVTRDRLYQRVDLFGKPFDIIDTGGINVLSSEPTVQEIRKQAEFAVDEADAIILVVDGRVGITKLDDLVAKFIIRTKKPLVLAINKIDHLDLQHLVYNFAPLGIQSMVPVSCTHGYNIAEVCEKAIETIDISQDIEEQPSFPKIAIIGRPNVGKSYLLNTLLGEERSIVSPVAGTTRDSIDTIVENRGKSYSLIDTAGIRRKHKEKEAVEKFAAIRTEESIERSDICLLVIDALDGITTEERKILRHVEEHQKGCIVLCNKWDLLQDVRMEHFIRDMRQKYASIAHYPILCISAKTGRNVTAIFKELDTLYAEYIQRISTPKLNKWLIQAIQKYHPPRITGKRLRIYYMTQTQTNPPHFVLFVNSPILLTGSYKRYLINGLREAFNFDGIPLTLTLRGKVTRERPPMKSSGQKDRDIAEIAQHLYSSDEADDHDEVFVEDFSLSS